MMRGSCTYVWVNSVRERDAVECFFSHRLMVQNVFTLCVYPPRDGMFSIILGHTVHRVSAKDSITKNHRYHASSSPPRPAADRPRETSHVDARRSNERAR